MPKSSPSSPVAQCTGWLTQTLRWLDRQPSDMEILRNYGELGNFPL